MHTILKWVKMQTPHMSSNNHVRRQAGYFGESMVTSNLSSLASNLCEIHQALKENHTKVAKTQRFITLLCNNHEDPDPRGELHLRRVTKILMSLKLGDAKSLKSCSYFTTTQLRYQYIFFFHSSIQCTALQVDFVAVLQRSSRCRDNPPQCRCSGVWMKL